MLRHTLSRLAAGLAEGLVALLFAGTAVALTNTSVGGFVLRASAVHTTDLTTQFINTANYCGAYVVIDATVDGALAVVTVKYQIIELGGGAAIEMESFDTATVNDVETVVLQIGTKTASSDGTNEVTDRPLPYRFAIVLDHADADAITYSASIHFLRDCT